LRKQQIVFRQHDPGCQDSNLSGYLCSLPRGFAGSRDFFTGRPFPCFWTLARRELGGSIFVRSNPADPGAISKANRDRLHGGCGSLGRPFRKASSNPSDFTSDVPLRRCFSVCESLAVSLRDAAETRAITSLLKLTALGQRNTLKIITRRHVLLKETPSKSESQRPLLTSGGMLSPRGSNMSPWG